LKTRPMKKIEIEDGFILVEDARIPLHRIREILFRGNVVWERRKRR